MSRQTSPRDAAAAFELSAALLERLGGPHALTARHIRSLLSRMAAARRAHRNAAIVALRTGWLASLSNVAAAGEISKLIRRYASTTWKRRDHAFPDVPLPYVGTMDEHLFKILAFAGEKPPGLSMIRRILDEAGAAKILPLESGGRALLKSRRNLSGDPVFEDAKAIAVLKTTPAYREAEKRATESEVASRRSHLAAIEKLDADSAKTFGRHEKNRNAAVAKVRAAERELRVANSELHAVEMAASAERLAYQAERREHEAALLVGDWSLIAEFETECRDEMERTRKATESRQIESRNWTTGRAERKTLSNSKSVRARLAAVLASLREAPSLRLIPDPRDLPARIAEMRASWPAIEDIA